MTNGDINGELAAVAGEEPAGPARRRRPKRLALTAAIAAVAPVATASAIQPSYASDESTAAATPVTGDELVAALTALLPEDVEITESEAEGVDTTGDPWAWLTAEDGSGGTSISLNTTRLPMDDWRDFSGCQSWGEPEDGFTCEDTELPDGSILSLLTWEYEEEGDPAEGTESYRGRSWEAWVEGPGGAAIDGQGYRSVSLTVDKDLTGVDNPDAYQPPVTLDRLAEIAQAPIWQDLLDEADERYGAPVEEEWPEEDFGYAGIPAEDLRATFRELAPAGLEITDGPDAEPGWTTLLADDGRGPALIDITAWGTDAAEGWLEDVPAEPDAAFELEATLETDEAAIEPSEEEIWAEGTEPVCEETELADGTQVSACDWPVSEGDPYAVSWVDVTYPDGNSISFYQSNDPTGESEPARADLPLSLDDLTEIATADQWRALFGN
jgi:hypothetical protein